MATNATISLLSQPYDCLLLVNPQIQVLERMSDEIQSLGVAHLNLSKELSAFLMSVSASERTRFSQKWLVDTLSSLQNGPVLCTCPDLLFDPSLEIDPLALFRQAARIIQLIVLWPGEYSDNHLSYAVPEHHHFRTWKVPDSLLRQPVVIIQRISTSQGA
jgi:hypothetical protein